MLHHSVGKSANRLAAAAALMLLVGCGSHPSDRELLRRFSEDRRTFETLKTMFLADIGLQRVGSDFTRPADPSTVGVTPDRIKRYRELCVALALEQCVESDVSKQIVWLHASTYGLSVTGSGKGYAYITGDVPGVVVQDLDTYHPSRAGSFTAFRKIQDRWYLYYEVQS